MAWIYDCDLRLAMTANDLLHSAGGFFTPFLKAVTLSGNGGAVFIATAVVLLLFARTRRAGVSALLALLLGVLMTNLILKNAVARARPFADVRSQFYAFWVQAGSLDESGYSFPSGHTTAAAAFAAAIFPCFRKRYSWVIFLVPAVMGFSRIYFGVHYASDVLAGMIVGIICGALSLIFTRLFMRIGIYRRFIEAKSVTQLFRRKKERDGEQI